MGFQPSGSRAGTPQALLVRGPLRAFTSSRFRLLWSASLLSIVSFFGVLIARGWLVLELTDSPFMVTAINAVPMLPMVVLSPLGGAIADRVSRRLILIVGDTFSSLVLLAMALLLFANLIQIWHVFVLSLFHGVAFAMGMPARAAAVPDVVDRRDLASGVALFTTIFSAGQLAGPGPAGYLIDTFGMGVTFLVASLMLAPAVGLLLALRLPGRGAAVDGASQASILASIAEGLAYVRFRPLLIGLLLLGLVFAVFAMPYQSILPVFARDILHMEADGLGLLGTAVGAGAVIGSFSVAFFSGPQQLRLLMIGGGTGFGLLILPFSFSQVFLLSLGLALGLGFLMQITLTSNFTLFQVAVPSYIRGRVLSIRMIMIGMGPVGMLLLGTGAETVGPPLALAAMGVMALALTAGIVLRIPVLRRREAAELEDRALALA